MDKVGFGVVGVGVMGKNHVKRLMNNKVKGAILTAVCDLDGSKREWMKNNFKEDIPFFNDYKEMINSGLIDAIMVSTPHYIHPDISIYAIEHGVHVLCEKPAGVYTLQVKKLNEVALKHKDITFGLMYNQRTNFIYRKAKEIIDNGRLGELKRVNWIITDWYRPQSYYDQGGWRGTWSGEGGGALINQCPHQIDLLYYLCGMPKSVYSNIRYGVNRNIKVENDVTALLEYENGATGTFITSTHDYPGVNRLEIDGDKGQIIIEKNKLIFKELSMSEKEYSLESSKHGIDHNKNAKYSFGMKYKVYKYRDNNTLFGLNIVPQHTLIFRNFTNHLLNGEKLIAEGTEGIKGLTISNAMHLSAFLNKKIDIPFDEELFKNELDKRIKE